MITANPVSLRIPDCDVDLQLQVHDSRDQVISHRLRETGIWEPYETQLVLALLQEGDVFVDVGANLGYFTVLAAARVGDQGSVYAFEPDPDNFALLEHNTRLNGFDQCVSAVRAALAESDGQGMLFLSEDNLGDHQVFDATGRRRSHPVRLLDGSKFLDSKASTVDLLKIDTQGSEHAVMAGLLPYLQRLEKPPQIIIELTPLSLRQAGSSGRALINSLAALNQPFWIIDHIEHVLAASDADALAEWCDNVDSCPGDEGFMNILVGRGIEGIRGLQ